MVGVSAEHRAAAGLAAGDEVDVDIELDTAPREVAVPDDFAAALDADRRRGARSTASRTATAPGTSLDRGREDRGDPPAADREVHRHAP